jgi:hypothetical protein
VGMWECGVGMLIVQVTQTYVLRLDSDDCRLLSFLLSSIELGSSLCSVSNVVASSKLQAQIKGIGM